MFPHGNYREVRIVAIKAVVIPIAILTRGMYFHGSFRKQQFIAYFHGGRRIKFRRTLRWFQLSYEHARPSTHLLPWQLS